MSFDGSARNVVETETVFETVDEANILSFRLTFKRGLANHFKSSNIIDHDLEENI